jgi:hypothetical protein
MSSRNRDKFRSYPSGNSKRQKKNTREKSLNKLHGSFNKFVTVSLNSTQSFQNSSTKNSQNSINNNTPVLEVDISEQINENYKIDTGSSSLEIDNEVEINKLQTKSNSSGNDFIINTVNDYDMTDIENDKFDTPSSSIKIDNEVEINKLQTENKSSSNDIINTVNDYDMTDIGCWPKIINSDCRKELIKLGPILVKSYNFPQSEINGGLRRFNSMINV